MNHFLPSRALLLKLFPFLFIVCLVSVPAFSGVEKADFYVSLEGSDDNVGSKTHPFRTIEKAQERINEYILANESADITVWLSQGRYEIGRPIEINSNNFSKEGFSLTYCAVDGQQVSISGGRKITDWKPIDSDLWVAHIDDVEKGLWFFRQLFTEGKRAVRSRWPNEQDREPFILVSDFKPVTRFGQISQHEIKFNKTIPAPNLHQKNAEIVALHVWSISRQRIDVSDSNGLKTQYPLGWIGFDAIIGVNKNQRCFLEHAKEFIDTPGEWYLERETGKLYYMAMPGQDPNEMEVIAPVTEQLLVIRGQKDKPVKNIHFKNINFEHADWKLPLYGYNGTQACVNGYRYVDDPTYMLPAAILLEYTQNSSFEMCRIMHTGANGLALGAGTSGIRVNACEVSDIGGNGLMNGWREKEDRPPRKFFENDWRDPDDAPQNNHFTNNHIHNCGMVQFGAVGYFEAFAGDSVFSYNDIHDLKYSAISVGYAWNDLNSTQQRSTISYNKISNVMMLLSDGGAVYTLGYQPGTLIENNFISNVPHGHGFYTDESSSGITLRNNIVVNAGEYGYQHHFGFKNVVQNNIFYLPGVAGIRRCKTDNISSFIFKNNIIVTDNTKPDSKKEAIVEVLKNDVFEMDENLYWDLSGKCPNFSGLSLEQWQKTRRFDLKSIFADPGFEDAGKSNFNIASDSPAYKLGFRSINTKDIGPAEKYKSFLYAR